MLKSVCINFGDTNAATVQRDRPFSIRLTRVSTCSAMSRSVRVRRKCSLRPTSHNRSIFVDDFRWIVKTKDKMDMMQRGCLTADALFVPSFPLCLTGDESQRRTNHTTHRLLELKGFNVIVGLCDVEQKPTVQAMFVLRRTVQFG